MNEDLDDMGAAEPLAGEELERVMARYARVRLDPSLAHARRARAAVMEEAWRRRIDPSGMVAGGARHRPTRRLPFAGWSLRRVSVALSAAVLAGLMVGTSAFSASRAGGPLYETRVALEGLALPADAEARVDAQLARAQARLAETVEAAGRHDNAATAAALDAYDDAINELETMEGAPAARALEAVRFHRTILLGIAAGAPAGTIDGLDRAIANSDRVIAALETPGPGTGAGWDGGDSGSGIGNPGAKPTDRHDEPTAKPTRSAKPAATDKPEKSQPAATQEPVTTVKPGRTPPPRKTPEPGKSDEGDAREAVPSNTRP